MKRVDLFPGLTRFVDEIFYQLRNRRGLRDIPRILDDGLEIIRYMDFSIENQNKEHT